MLIFLTGLMVGLMVGLVIGTVIEHFNTRCPRRYHQDERKRS